MRTWYFYSTPNSVTPSGYFKRVPQALADISRKGILRFRIWQGTHEAPIPVDDEPEPIYNANGAALAGQGGADTAVKGGI